MTPIQISQLKKAIERLPDFNVTDLGYYRVVIETLQPMAHSTPEKPKVAVFRKNHHAKEWELVDVE